MTCRTEILNARGMDLTKMYRGDAVETAQGDVGLVVVPGPMDTLVMFRPGRYRRLPTASLRLVG